MDENTKFKLLFLEDKIKKPDVQETEIKTEKIIPNFGNEGSCFSRSIGLNLSAGIDQSRSIDLDLDALKNVDVDTPKLVKQKLDTELKAVDIDLKETFSLQSQSLLGHAEFEFSDCKFLKTENGLDLDLVNSNGTSTFGDVIKVENKDEDTEIGHILESKDPFCITALRANLRAISASLESNYSKDDQESTCIEASPSFFDDEIASVQSKAKRVTPSRSARIFSNCKDSGKHVVHQISLRSAQKQVHCVGRKQKSRRCKSSGPDKIIPETYGRITNTNNRRHRTSSRTKSKNDLTGMKVSQKRREDQKRGSSLKKNKDTALKTVPKQNQYNYKSFEENISKKLYKRDVFCEDWGTGNDINLHKFAYQLEKYERAQSTEKLFICKVCHKGFPNKTRLNTHKAVHMTDKPYRCDLCNTSFTGVRYLKIHMKRHLKTFSYACNICGKRFKDHGNLKIHKHIHSTSDKLYRCDLCNYSCGVMFYLKRHLQLHVAPKSHVCNECGKGFKCLMNLKIHRRIHFSVKHNSCIKLYKCDLCNRTLECMKFLKNHIKRHLAMKPYACDICGKRYQWLFLLKRHKREHSTVKQYRCDVCNKGFNIKSKFEEHKYVHLPVKKYACDVCGKGFILKATWKNHVQSHLAPKPKLYGCNVCGKSFQSICILKTHKKFVHSAVIPTYTCDLCGKSFTTITALNVHKATHASVKKFSCDLCGRGFHHRSNLKSHLYIHLPFRPKPYVCNGCPCSFPSLSQLKKHQVVHLTTKPYKCDLCSKSFKRSGDLKIHRAYHSSEKPHVCDVCDRRYKWRSDLVRHKHSHKEG